MTDARLTELEIKYTLQQDLVLQLSDVVAAQGREIDRLKHEVSQLRGRVTTDGLPFDPDEKPPHY